MASELKTELTIPDLWFDFYARLLPGAVFVAAVRVLLVQDASMPSGSELFLLGAAGYAASFFTHPVTSWVTGRLHPWVAKRAGKAPNFVRDVQWKIGDRTNRAQILAKQHGEASSFMQLALFAIAFALMSRFGPWPVAGVRAPIGGAVVAVVSAGFAWMIAARSLRRAAADETAFNEANQSTRLQGSAQSAGENSAG